MPVLLSDSESVAILLFLSQCECQSDEVGAACQGILERIVGLVRVGDSSSGGGGAGAVQHSSIYGRVSSTTGPPSGDTDPRTIGPGGTCAPEATSVDERECSCGSDGEGMS